MSIICNTRCMNATLTGVQRYTSNILAGFPENISCIKPEVKWSRGITGHLWEQIAMPPKLNNNLLWSPSNSGPIRYSKQVVTIHDVVFADHPEWFNKTFVQWYNYMMPRLCESVQHIIAVSDFTKQRIMDLYKVPESKITRIYNGCDDLVNIQEKQAKPMHIPYERYVLALGSLEPRKNIPMLLRAWEKVLDQLPPDIGLIVVGAKGNTKIFKDAGITTIPNRVLFTGHLIDEHVAQLYSDALAFVYLSVYEGFGLPPLEAMSAGVPVITGNRTSLPEVIGDAGLKIDPYSQFECENALLEFTTNEDLRSDLSRSSKIQAQKFKWIDAAKQTWNTLERFNQ